jgi:hypothetical protein
MPYRQKGTAPWHGPGHFDDPFMIPEPDPIGEGPSQRRQGLIALAVFAAVVIVLVLIGR